MANLNGHGAAVALAVVPDAPGDFTKAEVALWDELWRLPQMREGDRLSVERLCRLESEAAALRKAVSDDGAVLRRPIQSAKGEVLGEQVVSHPALTPLRKIGTEIGLLCSQLGLTPVGRQHLGIEVLPDREPDALDELKARFEETRREARGEA